MEPDLSRGTRLRGGREAGSLGDLSLIGQAWRSAANARGSEATDVFVRCNAGLGSSKVSYWWPRRAGQVKQHSCEGGVDRPPRKWPSKILKPRLPQKRGDEEGRSDRDHDAADSLKASSHGGTARPAVDAEDEVEQ